MKYSKVNIKLNT